MLRKPFLIFLLICMTKCKCSSFHSMENLYAILDQTSEYFKNLSDAYSASDIIPLDNINNVIAKYVENTSKTIRRQRRSPQNNLQPSKGVNVLQDFQETLSITLPDFQDVAFITIQDEQPVFWLTAINSSRILLYQLVNNAVQFVGTYPQFDGKRIIAHNYSNGILIVVQKDTNEIVVLRLSKNKNGVYELHFKQEFEILGVSYIKMWGGMNQLYLGIASNTKVFVYIWLEEHFDKIDTLHFGAKKLLPFQSKSFMHIVVMGSSTKILRFSVRSNKFIETQRLNKARDINTFNFRRSHFEEQFLLLAGDNVTILYKELYNRFVPFQRITSAKSIHSLTMGNTVILLLKEKDTVQIYQYDGWKFLKLHIILSNIRHIHKIRLYNEDMLVVQKQNGEWKFLGPVWIVKKTWQSLQDEIHTWCSNTMRKVSQRTLEKIPHSKNPVKILNTHIKQLHAQNVNGHNATELIHLTQKYKKIMDKLNLANDTLTRNINAEESRYTVLHGKKIVIKCKTKCYIRHINTSTEFKPAAEFGKLISINRALEFTKLKIQAINDWKCPIPNFDIDNIFVRKSVNGIFMQNLQEGTLKISGDQEISGEHIFANLRAINVLMPRLDIATCSTNQTVLMKEARVKELYLTEDEFLLPLNGPVTTMSGSITAAKVKVTGFVHLKGGIKGSGREKLMSVKNIFVPLTLPGTYFLQNAMFRNSVKAKDIVQSHGLSLKEILKNSIPLNSNMPQRLILSSNKTHWYNVTLLNYKKWVTKNSAETVTISGVKFTNNSISLTDTTYANLPIPKLTIPLCTTEVITQEIKTSSITVDNVIVKNLNVSRVFGAYNLDNIISVSVSELQNIDFSKKLFTGEVFVKNISAHEIDKVDMQDFKIQMNEWDKVINRFKGSVNITKLVVNNLEMPSVFNFSLSKKINNVIVKANSYIGKINDIDISSFMENVLKVDNVIFLESATFINGFTSNHIHALRSTLNFSNLNIHPNLHSKRISGTLKTNTINIPQTFGYTGSNVPLTFVVLGTARFVREPYVQNIGNINLKQLSEDLWISNQDTVLSGSMNVKNITIQATVKIYDLVNSLNAEAWLNLSSRLLSKTKQQNITVASSFKNIEVPAIIATNNTIFQSSDYNLNTLLTNSLRRNMAQTVRAVWHFKELNIDNLYWDGKFNGIDLNTDIVRYNAERNIITGRKTIIQLTTKNLWSYNKNFSNWANNALTKERRKLSTIKGRKTFNNINLNNLSINGTIMGRNVEEALLKSGNQTVFGIKKIRGTLNAPSLIIDSTVNDVNLTQLIHNQAKKYKLLQTIETKIDFINDFEVFGNITVDGSYGGTNLINISNHSKLNAILNRMMKVAELAENVKIALHNPAIYINKFEAVNDNILETTLNPDIENVIVLNKTCFCEPKNISSFCNNTKLLNILADTNSSSFMMIKLVLLNDTVFAVLISSDFISIYAYTVMEQEFVQKAELYVPDILQVSVKPADNSLWIILRLPEQTLILRYQVWDELEQYVLPASDTFIISTAPNNQSLLIRSDGVWNLEGVFHPRHIFKMSLNGKIKVLDFGASYYIKVTTENSTTIFKARYIGN